MSTFLLTLNYALMILFPIIVAIFIWRKTRASWRFFFIGAVTFVASQILHIPFNFAIQRSGLLPASATTTTNLLIIAAFLGLSSGVFEETARYLTYRFWARDARSWSRGLMLGAGHGGIEAILLGTLAAVNFFGLLYAANNQMALSVLTPEQQSQITDTLNGILSTPLPGLLLGAVERLFAIATHLALSVLVLQVFLRRRKVWLLLAIIWHALLNMAAVAGAARLGPYATEALIGAFALASLFIIFRFRAPDAVTPEPEPLPPPAAADSLPLQPTDEALDRSRYS